MQTSVNTVERNVIMANAWLNDLSSELHDIDREDAWTRLSAVLQTLRDRISVNDAAGFAAQLPALIRGVFFDSWHPAGTPHKWRHKDDYFDAVSAKMRAHPPIDVEETIRAVLKVAARHMDSQELEKVKKMHPKEMWDLWPM